MSIYTVSTRENENVKSITKYTLGNQTLDWLCLILTWASWHLSTQHPAFLLIPSSSLFLPDAQTTETICTGTFENEAPLKLPDQNIQNFFLINNFYNKPFPF